MAARVTVEPVPPVAAPRLEHSQKGAEVTAGKAAQQGRTQAALVVARVTPDSQVLAQDQVSNLMVLVDQAGV